VAAGVEELEAFVGEALLRGESRDDIEKVLLAAGWTAEQARGALAAYADVGFSIPVPKPRASLSAREAFLYLTLFGTLYISACHLGSLVFDLVDRAFPDPALEDRGSWTFDSIRWSVSSLMIAFPVFLYLSRQTERELALHPIKRLSPVRRWLTYLTLFVAAGVLIGDLTTLVYNVLGGELTVRFLLKVTTVAAIAGAIFTHYLLDLRREEWE
jgi:energy-converting hydrogenase Eha subunit A